MVTKRTLLLILWSFGLLAGNRLLADVVTLQDGRQITGSLESGNTQELHIKTGDQSQTIDIHDVQVIQLGVSSTAPVPTKEAASGHATPEPNSLFLKDGKHVAGRWWSIDATDLHFLVNNQLEHYPRSNVAGVTFGNATLPPPPARSTAPPAVAPQPPATPVPAASAPPPARAPSLARLPSLTRPSGSAPPSHGLSQPEEIGMVYFWNGKVLIPLERNKAVEHKSSVPYFEMSAPKSPVRVSETARLVFILRLPPGVDPASYTLFQLVTVNGSRRTRSEPGRRGGLMTWQVDIEKNNESSLITYALTVRDLPTGEWSFSPSSSNDGYCFGVDPSPPSQ